MLPRSVSEEGASILDPCCGPGVKCLQSPREPRARCSPLTDVATLTRSSDTVPGSGDSCDADGPALPQVNHACRLPPPGLLLTQGRVCTSPLSHAHARTHSISYLHAVV
ncbi:hypothetical protein fugu_010657 [Takifugu bimaculatus]|uniref:Uncharacterized protein n=1 Tax=Takifugu bimaculatus TaxID=433685 RepID=A0A4Z2CAN1_9TELE|nr:hypothetical protein fugu_010657 [Takifugu bimaculatus]